MSSKINTGHATFDAAANGPCGYVGQGNVTSAVQMSNYVRPHHQTQCNGTTLPPGYLKKYDLDIFRGLLPYRTLDDISNLITEESILYVFFHTRGRKRILHGWMLTTKNHRLITKSVLNPRAKSHAVMIEMTRRLCEGSAHDRMRDFAAAF